MDEQQLLNLMMATQSDQDAEIQFGQKLLRDWMRRNKLEGISLAQSLHVFSRFEIFEIDFGVGPKRVDLFKMFYSGALPSLYYCLCKVVPDDMTENYHWLNQTRLDWVKSQIAAWIGAPTANYLASLP